MARTLSHYARILPKSIGIYKAAESVLYSLSAINTSTKYIVWFEQVE